MTYFMHNKINIKSIALWNPICRRSVTLPFPNGILIVGENTADAAFPPPPVATKTNIVIASPITFVKVV
jgi:hypothetical protein